MESTSSAQEPSVPPTETPAPVADAHPEASQHDEAAERAASRPAASAEKEQEYYAKTEKALASAKAKLAKIQAKEKSYKEKADKQVAKLEHALKASEEESDKNAAKIKKLQQQKAKTEGETKKREAACDKDVKKREAAVKTARDKFQKALADYEKDPEKPIKAGLLSTTPAKALFKLEDKVDVAEQELLAAQKRREATAHMIQLECQHIDNQCVETQSKVVYERQVNQYKLSQAQYDRDMALAKLADEKASAELAVQQYEKRLARRHGAMAKAAPAPAHTE